MSHHPNDDTLERYWLGMIPDEEQLAELEEHFLLCDRCVARADGAREYVSTVLVDVQ